MTSDISSAAQSLSTHDEYGEFSGIHLCESIVIIVCEYRYNLSLPPLQEVKIKILVEKC